MSVKKALLGVFLLAAVCPAVRAQKDPAAVEILAAAARNAGVAGSRLESLVATGTWTPLDETPSTTRRFTVKALAPDRVRWELETGEGLVVTAVSGSSGWTQWEGGERGLSVSEAVLRGVAWFPLLALPDWISSPAVGLERPEAEASGPGLRRIGIVPRSDEKQEDVRQALEAIGRIELLADPGLGRAVGIRLRDRSASDWRLATELVIEFGDVRPLQGVLTPHSITVSRGGVAVQRLVFDSIRLNAPVQEREFER